MDFQSLSDGDFMDTVRKYRVIYDKSCTDFKNKEKKLNAWKEISEKLEAQVHDCKSR